MGKCVWGYKSINGFCVEEFGPSNNSHSKDNVITNANSKDNFITNSNSRSKDIITNSKLNLNSNSIINLREEIKRDIIDVLKREIIGELKKTVVIIKELEIEVYVKLRRIKIIFIKLVVYVKIVVLKGFYVLHVIQFYLDLLLINIERNSCLKFSKRDINFVDYKEKLGRGGLRDNIDYRLWMIDYYYYYYYF